MNCKNVNFVLANCLPHSSMNSGIGEGDSWKLSDERFEQLTNLSPSAKFVYVMSQTYGRLDQGVIGVDAFLD